MQIYCTHTFSGRYGRSWESVRGCCTVGAIVQHYIYSIWIGSAMHRSWRTPPSRDHLSPLSIHPERPRKMSVIQHCILDTCCTAKSLTHLHNICMIHTSTLLNLGVFDWLACHWLLSIIALSTIVKIEPVDLLCFSRTKFKLGNCIQNVGICIKLWNLEKS